MTADHPTREERYAAVIAAHGPSGSVNSREGWVECECGERLHLPSGLDSSGYPMSEVEERQAFAAHVAAALVAADPAPAQPDATLSDVEQQVIAVLRSFWTHETPETLRPVAKALLAARATQPVPAPEVSGGVAEVRMLADEWDAEGADLIANCSTGRDVHEGETLRRCAASLRDALPADDGADCCRERTTAGGCGCGGGS